MVSKDTTLCQGDNVGEILWGVRIGVTACAKKGIEKNPLYADVGLEGEYRA